MFVRIRNFKTVSELHIFEIFREQFFNLQGTLRSMILKTLEFQRHETSKNLTRTDQTVEI